MPQWYLMRHAHAPDGPRMDADRGISKKGVLQAEAQHRFLLAIDAKPDLIISSDFTRAVETAACMGKQKRTEYARELRPDGTPEKAWAKVREMAGDEKRVLIVTHGPLIEQMLAAACVGFSADHESMRHADIAHFHDDGSFKWLVSPALAERLVPDLRESLICEALRLAESLEREDKAALVNPMIEKFKRSIVKRFQAQNRAYQRRAPFVNGGWRKRSEILDRAHKAGANYVAHELAPAREAKSEDDRLKRYIAFLLAALPPYARAAAMEDEIDATTQTRIDEIERSAAAEVWALAEIRAAVAEQFREWTSGETSRADMIAVNEISKAWHQGGADVIDVIEQREGTQIEKRWDTDLDPCEVCEGNAQDGFIPEDLIFTSGASEPPQHPRCRCGLTYRRA